MRWSFVTIAAAAIACGLAAQAARAAAIFVNTSGGVSGDTTTVWTVADPDVGNYTVTVSGFSSRSFTSPNNYYRNSSASGENDATINWTISGLSADAKITGFSLGTTQITPSVGSGSTWTYVTTLSGTDVDTSTPVTVSRTYTNSAGPQAHAITGNFGTAPVFSLAIDEQVTSTRTIGTRDFTITAVSTLPEPTSLLAAAAFGLVVRRRRR